MPEVREGVLRLWSKIFDPGITENLRVVQVLGEIPAKPGVGCCGEIEGK